MNRVATLLLLGAALALAGPAGADKGGKHKDKGKAHSAAEHAPGHGEHGRPAFSRGERDELEGWFGANPGAVNELPPGLAKKGKVPPGWYKRLNRGAPVPDDLWEFRVPLPRDVAIKLPPPPPGVIHVRINDRILKVVEKTHEILDILHLPHPPTPR